MRHPEQNTNLFQNLTAALTYLLCAIAVIVMPILLLRSIQQILRTKNPTEKRCKQLVTAELFCYNYAIYGLLVIPILHIVYSEWSIWIYYPSVWAWLKNYTEVEKTMGIMGDAFSCILLAPIFGLWSRRYGYFVNDHFYARQQGEPNDTN